MLRILTSSAVVIVTVSLTVRAQESVPSVVVVAPPTETSVVALDQPPLQAPKGGELIRQRFPNGSIQIERWVIESESGDFINHGTFVEYGQDGNELRSGAYRDGKRDGAWQQTITTAQVAQLAGPVPAGFQAPYQSSATFQAGQLHGVWTCTDANDLAVFEWRFRQGKRHGNSQWFDSHGTVIQQISYVDNLAHGLAKLRAEDSVEPRPVQFEHGRHPTQVDNWFPLENGQQRRLQSQDWYLTFGPHNLQSHDWLNSRLTQQPEHSHKKTRHGKSITFYPNGQRESEGQYVNGQRVGTFVWWYANGQQRTVGEYQDDREHGQWTWWHKNGMKEARGEFLAGEKVANWSLWDAEGRLVNRLNADELRLADRVQEDQR